MRRFFPDGLAGRFALLLVCALVAANLVAFALLSFERDRLGREARADREIERVAALVPALEAVAAPPPPGHRPRCLDPHRTGSDRAAGRGEGYSR